MMVIFTCLACSLGGLGNQIRGSGDIDTKSYELDDFTSVSLSNQGDLTIEYGEEEELVVEAEQNLIPYLEIRVVNDVLHIGTRSGKWLRPRRPIKYYLTVTELSALELTGSGNAEGPVLVGEDLSVRVTGSGDVTLEGLQAEDDVEIKVTGSGHARVTGDSADGMSVRGARVQAIVTGSGDIDLHEMEADRLEVKLTGSGNLTIEEGRVETQTIRVNGSGNYQARDLKSATSDVRVSGSGNVTICVDDELDASIAGSGDVRYTGDPTVHKQTPGSGNVKRVGE
jgi:hypothetical protein